MKSINTSKRKAVVIASVAAAVVLLGGVSAFTAEAKPFASGKQLLIDSLQASASATGTESTRTAPIEETATLQFKNVNLPGMPPSQAALLSLLEGATIHLDVLYDAAQKHAKIAIDTINRVGKYDGDVYITNNSALFALSGFQPLFATELPPGVTLPKYLVTDASQAQTIQSFWTSMNAQKTTTMTAAQKQSLLTLEEILVNAIPDKYIHRSGLAAIDIRFDQAGLQDILKAEVAAVYANKADVAKAVASMSTTGSGAGQATMVDLQQSVMGALDAQSEADMMANISNIFNAGMLTINVTTIHMSKSVFGNRITASIATGANLQDSGTGASLGLQLQLQATTPTSAKFTMPSTDSSNRVTFSQWLQSQMTTGGPS